MSDEASGRSDARTLTHRMDRMGEQLCGGEIWALDEPKRSETGNLLMEAAREISRLRRRVLKRQQQRRAYRQLQKAYEAMRDHAQCGWSARGAALKLAEKRLQEIHKMRLGALQEEFHGERPTRVIDSDWGG